MFTLSQVTATALLLGFFVIVMVVEHLLHPYLWGRAPNQPTQRSGRMRLTFRLAWCLACALFFLAIWVPLPDSVMQALMVMSALMVLGMNVWANHE